MKNLFLLSVTLIFCWGCEKENNNLSPINSGYLCDGNGCINSSNASSYNSIEECEENCGLNTDNESIEITYNIHESLPDVWITEFHHIINNLNLQRRDIYSEINALNYTEKHHIQSPFSQLARKFHEVKN